MPALLLNSIVLADNDFNFSNRQSQMVNAMRLIRTGEDFSLERWGNAPELVNGINISSGNAAIEMSSDILRQRVVNFLDIARHVQIAAIFLQDLIIAHKAGIARNLLPLEESLYNTLNVLLAEAVLVAVLLVTLTGINEKNSFTAVGVFLVNEDDAGRDARTVEKIGRQAHDTLDVVFFQNLNTDRFLRISTEQHTVRHDDARLAVGIEGFQDMQEPCEVAVLFWRNAITIKSLIFILGYLYAIAPRFIGERRVHDDEVKLFELTLTDRICRI